MPMTVSLGVPGPRLFCGGSAPAARHESDACCNRETGHADLRRQSVRSSRTPRSIASWQTCTDARPECDTASHGGIRVFPGFGRREGPIRTDVWGAP